MKPSVCLKCGCSIRRSKRHGPLEWILKRLFILPGAACLATTFLPVTFRKNSFYPPGDTEAVAHLGDVPHALSARDGDWVGVALNYSSVGSISAHQKCQSATHWTARAANVI